MGSADWLVVASMCLVSLVVGLIFTRRAEKQGASGYFTGNRSLPWWAIGLSNTATYQSGNGAFVMLVLVFGLSGNWLWWASWIIWMPLVAIIWARMWRRMQIVTTAELITLRYGAKSAIFGGLIGVVFTDVMQFFILFIGNLIFFFLAVPRHGGWQAIAERARRVRPESLQQFPPTVLIPVMTVAMLVVQGLFFAGSPTAGEEE